jgi:predicted O-linked N-acetylglucosamine transferase (SPINDLY family)
LWLLDTGSSAATALRREAERRGVAGHRLVFSPKVEFPDHLARLRHADLFLDTLPYNAGMTAICALWAGLPVVTCPGETFVGRMAWSLVRAAGVPELATATLADYETLALRLSGEAALLASYRQRLTAGRGTRPLFDIPRLTRHIEAAYVTMWEMHCRGETPRSFRV